MSVSQQIGDFNVYDIFSTFLPGAITIIGISAPHPATPNYLSSLSFSGIIVWSVVAFTTGLFLQIVAGFVVSVEDPFKNRISDITEYKDNGTESDNRPVTAADVNFVERARYEFGLGVEFDDWGLLYRGVLSEFERSLPSRAIRLQALFLAMRGLVVGLCVVWLTTVSYLTLSRFNAITPSLPDSLLCVALIILIPIIIVGVGRAKEFAEEVVSYMIIEYGARNQAQDN